MDWLRSSDLAPDHPVIVPLEMREQAVARASLEALGQARKLARELDVGVLAVAMSSPTDDATALLGRHGAQRLLILRQAEEITPGPAGFARLLAAITQAVEPSAILIAATPWGQERAARLSARLRIDMTSSITAWRLAEDGSLRVSRPVYGGRLVEEVRLTSPPAFLATLRPSLFPLLEDEQGDPPTAHVVEPPPLDARTAALAEVLQRGEGSKPLAEARIVVTGGAGVGGAEGFGVLEELAATMGAAVGASRAAVDAGWARPERQVGQTGTVVSPDVYFACGVSGAVQHRAGIRTARFIVAINSDPQAPIFRFSDVGIVGDLFEVVPLLTAELRQRSQSSIGSAARRTVP